MRVTVSKILNKTDLAQSESHGQLVVNRNKETVLKSFFGCEGQYIDFHDKSDNEIFKIKYEPYTSNGSSPNDRVTPIKKYATKHNLQPGDILVFDRIDHLAEKQYFIEYARRLSSVFFAGKSKNTVDILNFAQLIHVLSDNIEKGLIRRIASDKYEMTVSYLGVEGKLVIKQNGAEFELIFDDESISENKKYFELDTSVVPFQLKKTETWNIAMSADEEIEAANSEADDELISDLSEVEQAESDIYVPAPEQKAPQTEHKGKMVPSRSRQKAQRALSRANYSCEVDDHETFKRKKNMLPYTEPHHLIPLQYDDLFEYSLDVEANIVSLCSNCHNQIHYGAEIEAIIRKLWEKRKDELCTAGIGIMKDGTVLTIDILLSFYGM